MAVEVAGKNDEAFSSPRGGGFWQFHTATLPHPARLRERFSWRARASSGHALVTPGERRSAARLATLSPVKTVSKSGKSGAWTRSLLRCGLAAGPVFVAVFLAEGAVRKGYSPLRHPVSSLALGSRGWVQTGNFAVTGSLLLAGAAGLSRAADQTGAGQAGPVLIGAAGAGLLGSAAFVTDPVSGYPPGTPDAIEHPSRTGTIHNLSAIPVFLACPPRRSRLAGVRGALANAGSGSTARAPRSSCWRPCCCSVRASARHAGGSISAGCSSASASSRASPGSAPCLYGLCSVDLGAADKARDAIGAGHCRH